MTEQEIIDRMEEYRLPEYMVGGVIRYICDGIMPGSFLTSVMEHDKFAAPKLADFRNASVLSTWWEFIEKELPPSSHGSKEAVWNWIESIHREKEREVQLDN